MARTPRQNPRTRTPKAWDRRFTKRGKNCNNTLVHAIILAQPDLDFQDRFGDTALHKAAGYCSGASVGIKIIKALLDAGADPSIKNLKNETPLSIAVKLGEEDMAQVILGPHERGCGEKEINII